jgi:hypothetical protein
MYPYSFRSYEALRRQSVSKRAVWVAVGIGVATGWMARVRFPARERDFSLLHSIQTGSGALPASYAMGTEGFCLGGKAAAA